jgi:hypothetical protein
MKQNNFCRNLLIILLGFLSIGAFFGGIAFIIRPDGSLFQMPVEMLANSPFKDFRIPGIILLLTFGVFPAFVIYGLIKKPDSKFLSSLNLLYDHHFAWTFSVYTGIGLIIWINFQTLILNSVDILHTVYSSLGLLIICIALLPRTRKHYKLSPSGDSSQSYGNRDIII